jgi:2-oxoglutarate dehydrogenase E2 component (dihydrolipoamide succinyltransferase)
MVPVVRAAENLTFKGVEAEIKRLAIRARDGQITVDEMTGGTFTISNGGVFGSMLSTPIINPPQSGILGMHNVVERAIVKNGQIVIAPVMFVALSYDHRIIDGRESVGFLVAVKEALENPVEILMDGNAKKALEL